MSAKKATLTGTPPLLRTRLHGRPIHVAASLALLVACSGVDAQMQAPLRTDLVIDKGSLSTPALKRLNDAARANSATLKTTFPKAGTEVWTLPVENFNSFVEDLKDHSDPLKKALRAITVPDGDERNLFTRKPPSLTTLQQTELARVSTGKSAVKSYVSSLRRDNLTPQLLMLQSMESTVPVPAPRLPFDFNVISGLSMQAKPLSTGELKDGGTLLTLRLKRPGAERSSLEEEGVASLVLRGDQLSGILVIGGEVYSVHPLSDGTFAVVQRDRDGVDHPDVKPELPADTVETESGAFDREPPPIRVMVLHTARVAARSKAIADQILSAINLTNTSFSQSGVGGVAVELALIQSTGMAETRDIVADTRLLMARVNNQGDVLYKLRKANKANVVMLVADYEYPLPCGWAPMIKADVERAVATVSYDCLFTNFSLTHELGHIFGARHDKVDDPGEHPFRYGHGYIQVDRWRTIMAYPSTCTKGKCPRIPYWATPNISHPVDKTPLGTNDFEFDAKVIREQAARVGGLRTW